jgi:septal ring factor EnvC (AmiA/AmiB activator)
VSGVEAIFSKYETVKDENRKLEDENENLKEKCRNIEEQLAQTHCDYAQMKSKCYDLEQTQKDLQWEIHSLKVHS